MAGSPYWKPIASSLEADSWKPSTEFGWKPVFTFWLEARIYVLAGSPFLLESDLEGPARGLGWKPARRFFRTDSSSLAMFAEGSRNITCGFYLFHLRLIILRRALLPHYIIPFSLVWCQHLIFPILDLDATETYWFIVYGYPAVVTYRTWTASFA